MSENQETKKCPFCGEEILAVAQKCKHCGEFLTEENLIKLKAQKWDVEEKWVPIFELIETYWIDGKWWKKSPAFNKLSFWDKGEIGRAVTGCDALWGFYLFGPFDYMNKGMYLKAIVYTIIGCCTFCLGFLLFANTAFDYYRYKILGEQW